MSVPALELLTDKSTMSVPAPEILTYTGKSIMSVPTPEFLNNDSTMLVRNQSLIINIYLLIYTYLPYVDR
jgi:hypothetical protein